MVNKVEIPDAASGIPEGFIGPPTIEVNDLPCNALMDSGSTVTTIFEDWYKEHLPHVAICPVSDLAVWGLADSDYPYRGYVVVQMEFPEDLTGVKGPVVVLALICPAPPLYNQTPVIVGTNAFLFRRLFALSRERGSERKVQSMRIQAVYDQIETQT